MIDERCEITLLKPLAKGLYHLEFNAGKLVDAYQGAGQFIEILSEESWEYPLRRPMSIAGLKNGTMSVIFKILGNMTKRFTQLHTGHTIRVLGPLGNTFTTPDDSITPILVGGGVGLAPILNFHDELASNNRETILVIGARDHEEHFLLHNPCRGVYLCTDDGSLGDHGTVMPTIERLITSAKHPKIYACGPEPMLRAIKEFSASNNVPAELSVESYMGCGVGLCQGCVLPRDGVTGSQNTYHEKYTLVCKDGPIYNAHEVDFD